MCLGVTLLKHLQTIQSYRVHHYAIATYWMHVSLNIIVSYHIVQRAPSTMIRHTCTYVRTRRANIETNTSTDRHVVRPNFIPRLSPSKVLGQDSF